MASVVDVAQYILEKQGSMTAIKLEKLVYYCQAWALVWTDGKLFNERIEAWANGPVVPALFYKHQGCFSVSAKNTFGTADNLNSLEKSVIDAVLNTYGDKDSQWLVELTHLEDPWKKARGNTPAGVRSNTEINLSSMHEYYSGLLSS